LTAKASLWHSFITMMCCQQKFKQLWNARWVRRGLFICLLFLIVLCLGFVGLILTIHLTPLPSIALKAKYAESYRIFDRQGRLLREVVNADGMRAQWAKLNKLSPLVIAATIAVEDERFYEHSGVDPVAIVRALWQNVTARQAVSGASTITMQLARLQFKLPHTLWGKMQQAFDALRIERAIDKQTILEQYLNRAPYGAGTVGIEAASQRYFGKPSLHLSLAEAALLSGLPKSPANLNPLQNFKTAKKRQLVVLQRMMTTGKIRPEEFERARREPINLETNLPQMTAMHFTDYVMSQSPRPGDVLTTLDGDLQRQIEALVKDHVNALRSGGLTDAAVVVLNNQDGAILSMVGSADYWQQQDGSVNGALARRQPGSALKPFLYALAFERGFSPVSVVADIETQYLGAEGLLFIPQNYSERFYGPVLIKEALGRSLNIPAIRTLNAVGIDRFLKRLRVAGFISLDQDAEHYGLGLTLGNGEVTLLELAQGYAMFAREGLTCQTHAFQDTPAETPYMIFSKQICFLITAILSDESLRIQAFGVNNPLLLGFPMAIKTGTSANWRDNWVVGYTKDYTIAVWAGNFEGNPMHQLSGAIGAGPLFHNIAKLVVQRGAVPHLPKPPEPPEGVEQIMVCPVSGLTPTEHCPQRRSVHVLKEDKPRPPCNVHRLVRLDMRNGLLASARCPAAVVAEKVFEVLPPMYAEWQSSHGIQPMPSTYSPYCPENGITANALVITNPRTDEVYLIEPGYDRETQTLQLNGEVDPLLPEISWLVDGQEIAKAVWPYEIAWTMSKGRHLLVMSGGGLRSDPVAIEVR
jgi:penicillin-binding protein 1C